jgi:hypothetical protein
MRLVLGGLMGARQDMVEIEINYLGDLIVCLVQKTVINEFIQNYRNDMPLTALTYAESAYVKSSGRIIKCRYRAQDEQAEAG